MLAQFLADPAFLAVAVLSAVLVGLSKGGLPVVGMLAVPLLALFISPVTAAAMTLPVYVISDMFGLYYYRRYYSARNILILVPAGFVGVAIGWATATVLDERWVTLLVGVVGLVFCINWFLRRNIQAEARPADVPRGLFWGALTGFTSFVSHSGAPPYQVYVLPQRLEKLVFAGTATIVFAFINFAKLIPYYALGGLTLDNLEAAAVLMPAALAGVFVGFRLVKILPERAFFALVQAALFLLSLKLIYDGLTG